MKIFRSVAATVIAATTVFAASGSFAQDDMSRDKMATQAMMGMTDSQQMRVQKKLDAMPEAKRMETLQKMNGVSYEEKMTMVRTLLHGSNMGKMNSMGKMDKMGGMKHDGMMMSQTAASKAAQARVNKIKNNANYNCCIKPKCDWCAVHMGSCPCGKMAASDQPVCINCKGGWEAGQGVIPGKSAEDIKVMKGMEHGDM